MVDDKELVRISTVAARKYARKVFWASVEDMTQEALVAVVKAKTTWDPQVGVPFGAYAYRAALLAIRPYLWKNSSPVSESWHRLPTLKGVHRAEVPKDLLCNRQLPEDELAQSRWRDEVYTRLMELDDSKGLAVAVMLDGEDSAIVAERFGVTTKEVYAACSKMKHRMEQDWPLWKLWFEERP